MNRYITLKMLEFLREECETKQLEIHIRRIHLIDKTQKIINGDINDMINIIKGTNPIYSYELLRVYELNK